MKIIIFVLFCVTAGLLVQAAPRALLLLSDQDEPQCKPPTGNGGLQSVIDEFVELVPINKILPIYITAVSSDPEVQDIMEFIQSEDFKNIILSIQEAPDFYGLMEFGCNKLYLDAYFYYNKFAELFDLPKITRPPPTLKSSSLILSENDILLVDNFDQYYYEENQLKINSVTNRKRKGLKGMLLDMYDELPFDEIKKKFENKLETDEYVKATMNLLASNEFKKIVNLVENLNEFEKLIDKLRGMDIDIDNVIEIIKKFFKWD